MALVKLDSPIFIVEAGRSGATLVQALLGAHPQVAVPPETRFMKMADRFGAATHDAPADPAAFWTHLIGWPRFHDPGLAPEEVARRADPVDGATFRDTFAAMLATCAAQAGKRRAGAKTPGHYRYWRRLPEWFPDARILPVRQDPRAVAASALETPWGKESRRRCTIHG
ncbi:sulfotransferase [uncultured Jannaschia sp.]|uniref:sulfotransferase n=1 Tax=uncultured Jannaschia sp. TaxID=293347 RepID=UPI0026052E8A|nr:sulfotransferase [uncultured Jannaschia sp.]